MDVNSLIAIVIAIIVIYFFIKFVVNPAIKVILGIVVFLIIIYLLQRFFGFDLNQVLTPFGIHLKLEKMGIDLNWISEPVNYVIIQIENFMSFIWQNIPKYFNK